MGDLPINAPSPRLCHIVKWPDFDGYGFNIHADKTRPGQYIGKVDENSPADTAGLREGDRIIEVNGVNISNENHKQVVQRIRAVSNETRLLVVDSEADRWYKTHNFVVRGDQPNVITGTSQRPAAPDSPTPSAPSSEKNSTPNLNEDDSKSVQSSTSSSHSEKSSLPQHGSNGNLKDTTCPELIPPCTMEEERRSVDSEDECAPKSDSMKNLRSLDSEVEECSPTELEVRTKCPTPPPPPPEMTEECPKMIECPLEAMLKECALAEPVMEQCPPTEPVMEECPSAEPVMELCPQAEPVLEVCPQADPVLEVCPQADPVLEVCPPAEPVMEVCPPAEPVMEVCPPAEPVMEVCPPAEPVMELCPQAEPVLEECPQAEPVLEECPPPEPVMDQCPPFEPEVSTAVESCADESDPVKMNGKAAPIFPEDCHSLSSSHNSCESSGVTKPDSGGTGSLPDPEPVAEERKSPMSTTPSPPPSINPEGSNGSNRSSPHNSMPPSSNGGLNLNMSAAEMRALLAQRKKVDPRKTNIDLKQKFHIVQNM